MRWRLFRNRLETMDTPFFTFLRRAAWSFWNILREMP
jgi:hypothetical protein